MQVSIITVCKNSEGSIEKAIQSVLSQTYRDIEYIIIDGASTDQTVSIIHRYTDNIDVIVSEKDCGIYNAMNKGITYSNGNILYFLNSDDFLHDKHVIDDVSSEFTKDNGLGILYGNVIMCDGKTEKKVKYNSLSPKFFYKNTLCHQAVFARKEVFGEIGKFNESYKIHADTDWLMRVYFRSKIHFKYLNRDICHFSTQGFCSNPINAEKYKFDRQEISAKYFFEARYKLIIKKLLIRLGLRKY